VNSYIGATWQIGQTTVTQIEGLIAPSLQPQELLATWEQAASSLTRVLGHCAERNCLVLPTHLACTARWPHPQQRQFVFL
jgi:hypothetical protein